MYDHTVTLNECWFASVTHISSRFVPDIYVDFFGLCNERFTELWRINRILVNEMVDQLGLIDSKQIFFIKFVNLVTNFRNFALQNVG